MVAGRGKKKKWFEWRVGSLCWEPRTLPNTVWLAPHRKLQPGVDPPPPFPFSRQFLGQSFFFQQLLGGGAGGPPPVPLPIQFCLTLPSGRPSAPPSPCPHGRPGARGQPDHRTSRRAVSSPGRCPSPWTPPPHPPPRCPPPPLLPHGLPLAPLVGIPPPRHGHPGMVTPAWPPRHG